ncbi:hypothetical protein DSCW_08950 [Desulfosarcina widdelii]|uniref:Threonine transporter n=1 Tax=Desulfosarcina widdelii TaxID=947919 RepID=A0A5K7YXZ1_9BACT|nr:ABC-three component system middle component 2 [Desulfosarcina widdelii]BBO73478.1 hypothetical protein DSCW_08950 [Desulfosarcina widdelii]
MMKDGTTRNIAPFNSSTEIGLRSTVLLFEMYPDIASLQRLVVYDYLLVHSDDVPDGPEGLHPKTPYRSGELLVRRDTLQKGLLLYMSRGLIRGTYLPEGVRYLATERTGGFIESFDAKYVDDLRSRATWLVEQFGERTDEQLDEFAREHLGEWGAEFETEALLWEDNHDE